jgi:hypothetical protein
VTQQLPPGWTLAVLTPEQAQMLSLLQQQQAVQQALQQVQTQQGVVYPGLPAGNTLPGAMQYMVPAAGMPPVQVQPQFLTVPHGGMTAAVTHHVNSGQPLLQQHMVHPSTYAPGQLSSTSFATPGVPAVAHHSNQATSSLNTILHTMQQQAQAFYPAHPAGHVAQQTLTSNTAAIPGHMLLPQQGPRDEDDLAELMNLCGVE